MKPACLLSLLTAGSFYCYLCYTVIAPFIPGEIARRGLSPVHNGIIIALISLNGFFMPPVIQTKVLPLLGYSKSLALGALVLSGALFFFGVAYFFSNNVLFIALTYVSRFFQGLAGNIVFQSAWAVLGIAFSKNVARAASTFNIGMTIGLAGGPFLGGALYSWFGYIGPFFLFGAFTLVYAALNLIFNVDKALPPSVSTPRPLSPKSGASQSGLKLKHVCCNTKPVLGLIVYFFSLSCLSFFEPILADKLSDTFGYTSDQVAYFYARFTVASFVGNSMMIVLNWKNYSWLMASLGFAFSGIGCILLAPESFLLNMETTPGILTTGLVFLGIGCEILLNTSSALTLDSLNQIYPGQETEVGKVFAQVRINVAASSFLVGPFSASLITDLTSYEVTCTWNGLILLNLFVFYFLFTLIAKPDKKRDKMFQEEMGLTEPLLQKF